MLGMKWVAGRDVQLVAKWKHRDAERHELDRHFADDRAYPSCSPGGPPGQRRGILQSMWGVYNQLRRFGWAFLLILSLGCLRVLAQDVDPNAPGDDPDWTFHVQATAIPQAHGDFHSPYQSTNSLDPNGELKASFTTTFYVGRRLWKGAELYINPEILGGEGLSKTLGIAGFPNGEIYRVDTPTPKPNISRFFVRQTWGIGEETQAQADGQNELRRRQRASRFTLTFGKFSLVDLFDDNKYSHDARTQFMNWALMDNGAWDFCADTRGYTYGLMLEFVHHAWTVRYGLVEVPKRANGMAMDLRLGKAHSDNLEVEHDHVIGGHSGALRLMAYGNNAHMGSYRETLDTPAFQMDVTKSRAYRLKYGFGVNAEQEITRDLGVFFRYGWNDGHTETWVFTEIDRTGSVGLSLAGSRWKRRRDCLGAAFVENGISKDHREYLAAGGKGFIIGDGRLNYGREEILETYYSVSLGKGFSLSPDFQWVENPAYNCDRGPVPIEALRLHWEY